MNGLLETRHGAATAMALVSSLPLLQVNMQVKESPSHRL